MEASAEGEAGGAGGAEGARARAGSGGGAGGGPPGGPPRGGGGGGEPWQGGTGLFRQASVRQTKNFGERVLEGSKAPARVP